MNLGHRGAVDFLPGLERACEDIDRVTMHADGAATPLPLSDAVKLAQGDKVDGFDALVNVCAEHMPCVLPYVFYVRSKADRT